MEKEGHEIHHHSHEECSCGQEHFEHSHHGHEECGCGHEENEHSHHGHKECGCGHEEHEHSHHGHEECGCGQEHHEHSHHGHEECGCGHEHHEHSHHGHEECGCGHEEHEHSHHGHEECSCGHDHHHGQEAKNDLLGGKSKNTTVYLLENLGCANCAAKMEKRIRELPGVDGAAIVFATKQLRLSARHPEKLLPEIQKICASIESEVKVVPRMRKDESSHNHGEETEKKGVSKEKRDLYTILIGAVLFLAGEVLEHLGIDTTATLPIYVVGYLLLGGEVLLHAGRNMVKGQIFDENFLMSLATLGAFAIKNYPEAVGVMLFYRIGEYFEEKAVEKSRSQIMDAIDLRPETVQLVQGEEIQVIPAQEAKPGDILLVRPGDRIPLDGVIVDGESRLDTSAITGEPVPVKVAKGNEVISGCVNESGQLKIRVEKELEESMVSRILNSVENAAASKPKIDRFITRFARIYTPVVVALAVGTAILPSLFTGNWHYWIYTAITFLVMSCPCALVLSVPLAFFSGIGVGSKLGILFKGGAAIEALSKVKAVVMDKTGTITEGNFVVQSIHAAADYSEEQILAMAASCEQASTHPIAVSIVSAAREKGLELARPAHLEEISGHGIKAETEKGTLLVGNRALMSRWQIDLSAYQPEEAGSEVLIALNEKFIGNLYISDTIKADAETAVRRLKKSGIITAMLTGDAKENAEAVAKKIGMDEVHARLLPEQKLEELRKIRSKYECVMFVGDGINDAPVLAGADVGAAMGSGADAAIEAADVVFMKADVEAIPQAISIAVETGRIAMQNVVFALVIKALTMLLGLLGYASMWMAVFADTGVAMICILNSIRILYKKRDR